MGSVPQPRALRGGTNPVIRVARITIPRSAPSSTDTLTLAEPTLATSSEIPGAERVCAIRIIST